MLLVGFSGYIGNSRTILNLSNPLHFDSMVILEWTIVNLLRNKNRIMRRRRKSGMRPCPTVKAILGERGGRHTRSRRLYPNWRMESMWKTKKNNIEAYKNHDKLMTSWSGAWYYNYFIAYTILSVSLSILRRSRNHYHSTLTPVYKTAPLINDKRESLLCHSLL